ncbi:hypothetical protein OFC62_42430, partial [Escherichia coli]|nr:hypothetical protein [Escherichia coli]
MHDLDSSARLDSNKSTIVLIGFAAVIACALLELVPIIKGLAVYIIALIAFGIVQLSELRRRFP